MRQSRFHLSNPLTLCLVILFSLIVGGDAAFRFSYAPSRLTVEMQVSTSGTGQLFWDSRLGFNESESRRFPVTADERFREYVVEIPRTRLAALRIDPFDARGSFAIRRVVLESGSQRHEWRGGDLCREVVPNENVAPLQCDGVVAGVARNDDPSLVLAKIPGNGFATPVPVRLFAAVVGCAAAFLTGVLCCRLLVHAEAKRWQVGREVRILLLMGWVALYLYHGFQVVRHAVDVPFHDEWYLLEGMGREGLSPTWLFSFHNEHRIVITKLMAWVDFKLFSLDFRVLQIANFIIFGVLLAAIHRLGVRLTGNRFGAFPAFTLFLLSLNPWENHFWGFQSQFHLTLLFFVLAIGYGFELLHSLRASVLFSTFCVLSMYSFSSGVVTSLVLLLAVLLYGGVTLRRGDECRSAALPVFVAITIVGGASVLWFQGYHKPLHHPPLALPTTSQFWDFFLNVTSLGFGFNTVHMLPGILCLVLVLTPLVILFMNRETRGRTSSWQVSAGTVAILVALAAISLGRGNLGGPKAPRYAEIAGLLIPLSASALWLAIRDGRRRVVILALVWVILFVAQRDNWRFDIYREQEMVRRAGLDCIRSYYDGEGKPVCPEVFPRPMGGFLDRARGLELNFVKTMMGTPRKGDQ